MRKTLSLFIFLALVGMCPLAFGDDAQREKTESEFQKYRFKKVTTPEGLNFNIPEDMPIETRNGLKGPIPYDEYLYFKIMKLNEKITQVEGKVDTLASSLDKLASSLDKMSGSIEKIKVSVEDLQKKNEPSVPGGS